MISQKQQLYKSLEWNGYTLADTPGVGAPMDHEKITDENLKKADIVLFVMSTTGSTEKKIIIID